LIEEQKIRRRPDKTHMGINGCDVNVKKHLSIDSKDKVSTFGSQTKIQREGKQGCLDG
jgi:hypothetical protein